MPLITNPKIVHVVDIDEKTLREALVREALEALGLIHNGKPAPGATTNVTFDGRRGGGTYTITITRPVQIPGQQQLTGPTENHQV